LFAVLAALAGGPQDGLAEALARGHDVNGAHDGRSLLEHAGLADNTEIARLLLTHGARFDTRIRTFTLRWRPDAITRTYRESAMQACASPEMATLLASHGAPLDDLDRELIPGAIGAALLPVQTFSPADFARDHAPRSGIANPELCTTPFYLDQIRSIRSSNAARAELSGAGLKACDSGPVWSFERFGRSITQLPDGRRLLISGEHEDHYDPDFYIYNDVVVLDGQGGAQLFLYPTDIFPPTDFHSATLFGDHVWLIGNLGDKDARAEGRTQVLRLSLIDFSVARIATSGRAPGWIHRHDAVMVGDDILISGGKVEPGYRDLEGKYALNLLTRVWRRSS
jgi:hypothetical protein